MSMRCVSDRDTAGYGMWLDDVDSVGTFAAVLGLLVAFFPLFLAGWLVHYRQHDYFDKAHPEGIVTPLNIHPEWEELGERLSQLDDKWHLKAFGFFYRVRFSSIG